MKTYSATEARKNIYNIIESVELSHQPVQITSKRSSAVMISESDWNAIQETLYLLSFPKMGESIREGMNTPLDDCNKDLDW